MKKILICEATYAGNSFTNTEKAAAVILGLYYEPKTFHEGLSQTMPDPSF